MILGSGWLWLLSLHVVCLVSHCASSALHIESHDPDLVVKTTIEDPPLGLNRFNFRPNVIEAASVHVEHWVVRFCHPWFMPCAQLTATYLDQADYWQKKLNRDSNLYQRKVRFAEVDCSVDKPLCNEEGIYSFPAIQSYSQGKRLKAWNGRGDLEKDAKTLPKWLAKQLEPSPEQAAEERAKTAAEAEPEELPLFVKVAGWVLLVMMVVGNYFMIASHLSDQATRSKNERGGAADMAPAPHRAFWSQDENGASAGAAAAMGSQGPVPVSSRVLKDEAIRRRIVLQEEELEL